MQSTATAGVKAHKSDPVITPHTDPAPLAFADALHLSHLIGCSINGLQSGLPSLPVYRELPPAFVENARGAYWASASSARYLAAPKTARLLRALQPGPASSAH